MNTTILDTHLHLYPCFDLSYAFNQFLKNTANAGAEVSRVACLAERHDCRYFESLSKPDMKLEGFTINRDFEHEIRLTRVQDGLSLSLLPGRQIISSEGVEVLALGCPEMIDDGQPALDVIYQIAQFGHLPVLPWSPGKWFGGRGELIRRLIMELQARDFLIGDTTLRPYGWPLPRLMQLAQNKGFAVVAGSDPLPFSGEERWLGRYYTVLQTQDDLPAYELLHLLKNQAQTVNAQNTGRRTHVFNLFNRLRKNAASKKHSA